AALAELRPQPAAGRGAREEAREGGQRRGHREPARAGQGESQQDDVAGHVRDEDAAERQEADGVDPAGGGREHEQPGDEPRGRMRRFAAHGRTVGEPAWVGWWSMATLLLGPVLRHVGERDATVWVETDR